MRARDTILAATLIAALSLLAACSDDSGGVTPDSTTPDSTAGDMTTGDIAPDGPAVDGPAADGPITAPDGTPAPDAQQKPDTSPPDQGPPPPDGPKTSCQSDQDCKLFEDCCSCNAIYAWETMPSCKMACKVKACKTKQDLDQPEAYCLAAKGKCFLGDGGACASDADCKLINDCCSCMAVPLGVTPPKCAMTCLVDSCTGLSLPNATAVCQGGKCRIKP